MPIRSARGPRPRTALAVLAASLLSAPTPSMASSETLRDLLIFFDQAVDAGTLWGLGPGESEEGRRGALRNQLVEAGALLEGGDLDAVCDQLAEAVTRTDGARRPPDFVTGSAAPGLATRITSVRAILGCIPAVCSVALDKQLSCDGGQTFVDEGFEDDGFGSCLALNGFEGSPGEPVLVRYLAQNTGNVPLEDCILAETNPALLPAPRAVEAPELGAPPVALFLEAPSCSAELAGGEPGIAALACTCPTAAAIHVADDVDGAEIDCRTPALFIEAICEDGNFPEQLVVEVALVNAGDVELVNCLVTIDTGIETRSLEITELFPGETVLVREEFGPQITGVLGLAVVACQVDATPRLVTAESDFLCVAAACGVDLTKQIVVGTNRFDDANVVETLAVGFEYGIANTSAEPVLCALDDALLGPLGTFFVAAGSSVSVAGPAMECREAEGTHVARAACDCGSGEILEFFDEATLTCLPAECDDAQDNDGDGRVDLDDPGCEGTDDASERSDSLACDDGRDNDGDGRIDFDPDAGEGDAQCRSPEWPKERACGLGFELALLMPLLLRCVPRRRPRGR